MGFPNRVPFHRQDTTDAIEQQQQQEDAPVALGDVKSPEEIARAPSAVETADPELSKYVPDEHAQGGVKKMEAATLSWTKTELYFAYGCFFFLYFVNAFQASITGNLIAFVLSDFSAHSLIPLISVVSNVMSAAVYLPLAKTLDLWGRPQGFSIMAGFATLGLILMATCSNVQTYCAAQVFYSIGFSGMIFSVDVMTTDSSSLRDRGLAFAFTSSPYIITALAGPKAAEGFYENISWRWAFGCFAIILPFVAAPLFALLLRNERKARRNGLLVRSDSGRTVVQSIWHYMIEFDALGVVTLAVGLVLFLIPFSLAENYADSYSNPSIIAMLVIGIVLLIVFGFVERFVAPKPFIPYHLLLNRTVLGACILDATYQVSYYCWASYFTSYLQVVNNLNITQAGWISGIFDIIAGCWLLIVGYAIRRTGRFRWVLVVAVPLYTLGVGLMIYFRRPHTNIGFIIMCQIFLALSGSLFILCEQVAVTAVADHGDVAAMLAMLGLFGYMGGAVGNAISGAIWTNSLPVYLQKYLPDSCAADWEEIYNDLDMQLSYPMGDPCREGIIDAYGVAQKRMLTAGTAIMVIAFGCVFLIKNLKVTRQQTKGVLF